MALSTTNTVPLYNDNGISELLCANGTGAAVACAPVYTFLYDSYGNNIDGTGALCSAWSYSNISGASSPAVSGGSHSYSLSHSAYIDGQLTCTKAGVSRSVLTYGGLSRVALTHNYTGPVIAANANVSITSTQLYFRKNNVEIVKSNAGTETIAFSTTSALGIPAIGQAASLTCAFNASGVCATSYPFNMTRVESGSSITMTIRGMASSISAISVEPAAAAVLTATPITAKAPNATFTAQVQAKDSFANLTSTGCGPMTVTGGLSSPGGHGGSATTPVLPADVSQSALGIYTTGSIQLYKEGTNTLTFSACGLTTNANVTVSEGPVNAIYLSNTNSAPASHLASISCTNGSTVSCPPLYSFAWDAYGNEISDGAYSCNAWSFVDNTTNMPKPTFSFTTGHSSAASATTWHVNGSQKCSSGTITASTSITGRISKNYTMTCGNWTCPTSTPTATCTISNATGYPSTAYTFSGAANGTSLSTSACDSGLASGSNCQTTVSGVTGAASGAIAVLATEEDATIVEMLDPNAVSIQSGALAPSCTTALTQTITSDWSCLAGKGRHTVTLTNNNALNSATFGLANPIFTAANGATLVSTTCKSISLAPGQSCNAIVEQPNAGQSSTLVFDPSDAFFADVSVLKGNSPNCSQTASVSYIEAEAKLTTCAESPKRTRLTFTLTNPNTLSAMTFPAAAISGATIIADSCSNTSLAAGGNCNFTAEWSSAPTGNISSTAITILESSAYFNNITINSAAANNSCP